MAERGDLEVGRHVRTRYGETDFTVMRVADVPDELAPILVKEGHPPKWGGRTAWHCPDELVAAYRTKSGRVLTDPDFEALADEEERADG